MIKIVIDKDIPFLEGLFDPFARVVRIAGKDIGADAVKDADALIVRTRTKCNAALLEHSTIKLIATATIGTDHIDTDWCRSRGIEVCNAPGCNARAVLQWVAAVLVHLLRRRKSRPEQTTLGIIGVGHVGSLVLEYAEMWGFKTLCCDPPREEREHLGFMSARDVFMRSDIVTLHVPLDATTYHLVDKDMLSSAHKPFIINASRGETVDTEAILASGAEFALDVWEGEPNIDLRALARAEVATPHIAGYSLQGKANASAAVVQAIARYFGLPLTEWYPSQAERSKPSPITWEQLCSRIGSYCDIDAESRRLKEHPHLFEKIRNEYDYRQEFF